MSTLEKFGRIFYAHYPTRVVFLEVRNSFRFDIRTVFQCTLQLTLLRKKLNKNNEKLIRN